MATRKQWSLYARQHSQLLLQVTTTNIVESWHNSIKKRSGATRKKQVEFSLCGLARMIHETGLQWDAENKKRAWHFDTKKLSIVRREPGLSLFPFPIQKLLHREIKRANAAMKEGKDPPSLANGGLECWCRFFRAYSLPCFHLWHAHLIQNCITRTHLEHFARLFEESGYEVYEGHDRHIVLPVFRVEGEDEAAQLRDTLQSREYLELLRSKWYDLLDQSAHYETEKREAIRIGFLESLHRAIGPLLHVTPLEILSDPRFSRSSVDHRASGLYTNTMGQQILPSRYDPPAALAEDFERLFDAEHEREAALTDDDDDEAAGLILDDDDASECSVGY